MSVTAQPAQATVACDGTDSAQLLFSATVTATGPGTVNYRWERSDGAQGPDDAGTLTFTGAGSQQLGPLDWTLGVPVGESSRRPGYTLRVTAPDGSESTGTATATLACR